MTNPTVWRRPIAATLCLATVLSISLILLPSSPAGAMQRSASTDLASASGRVVHRRACNIDWRRGPGYVKRLIWCAAVHWRVPGGPQKALFIAWRESHYIPTAYNPSGALGIYQHMRQYWPMRAATYGFPHCSAFNARVNIIVTMRMVRAIGSWSPWGG